MTPHVSIAKDGTVGFKNRLNEMAFPQGPTKRFDRF